MTFISLFSRAITRCVPLSRTVSTHSKTHAYGAGGLKWMALIGVGGGAIIGLGYGVSQSRTDHSKISGEAIESKNWQIDSLPNIKPSRIIVGDKDSNDLDIWLYQYQTCPFCCKVRAFLDYHGLSYSLVEVNPVLRKETSWSTWKKVPIVLVKYKDRYQLLYDSSMIISALTTYLEDRDFNFSNVNEYYPVHPVVNKQGKQTLDVQNKYFLMKGEKQIEKSNKQLAEERKWRSWVDDVLVHMLSPNVYRTPRESLQAFNWFSEVGQWKEYFSTWERYLVVYVGAAAMYFIGKRLKSRYNLDDEVRYSLYSECNKWARHVDKKGDFGGGSRPDLSDLSVFGVLNAIEGCDAWKDVLSNTDIGPWYDRMKQAVNSHEGLLVS